jgi:hypothetical protein
MNTVRLPSSTRLSTSLSMVAVADVLQRQAFAVDDDGESESDTRDESPASGAAAAPAAAATRPPATAEEYLRMVRREARRCPPVVVSNIDPRQFDSKQVGASVCFWCFACHSSTHVPNS